MRGYASEQDPFALSWRLYGRWLQSLSSAADAGMRSKAFLLWMHYAIKTTVEVRRMQDHWFGRRLRPETVDPSTSDFP